jgi:uncharacterized protein (TIRG00374 family)
MTTAPAAAVSSGAKPPRRHGHLRTAIQAVLSLTVVGVIFLVVLPQHIDVASVKDALANVSPAERWLLGGMAVFYAFAAVPLLTTTTPGLRFWRAFMTQQITTAVARLLPGGGAAAPAIRYRYWHGWGLSGGVIATALVSIGALSGAMWLALPVVAVIAASLGGEGSWGLALVAIIASLVLLLAGVVAWRAIRQPQAARAIGGWIRRAEARVRRGKAPPRTPPWDDRIVQLRNQLVDVLEQRGGREVAAAALSAIAGYLVLLVCLRVVGVTQQEIDWRWILVGYSVGNILGAIPITPSGLGISDLGVVSVLSVGQDEATQALIVAGQLLFRVVTYVTPIFTGGVCYLLARRSLARAAATVSAEEAERDAAGRLTPAG